MKAFKAHLRNFENDQRATALIELAVVLPILLSICLGVFEFGNAIYGRHLIENGIRDAARYAAGLPKGSAISDIKCIALTGGLSVGTNCTVGSAPNCTTACRVTWLNDASIINVTSNEFTDTGTNYCGNGTTFAYCRGGDSSHHIYTVTVSTDVPYAGLGFLGYFGLSGVTMHVEHSERLFGVR